MLNDRVDAKEVSDASQLPYSQQISQTIVVTEAGDYTATLQVHGISFDTMTNAEIDGLNRTWLSAIHTASRPWTCPRPTHPPHPEFHRGRCRKKCCRWRARCHGGGGIQPPGF